MPKTLTITDEKVKEAAAKCGTAKEILSTLFPEVFADRWETISHKDIVAETDIHEAYGGWDIHLYHKDPKTGAKVSLGYITTDSSGKPSFSNYATDRYRVFVKTDTMSDRAIIFEVQRKASASL